MAQLPKLCYLTCIVLSANKVYDESITEKIMKFLSRVYNNRHNEVWRDLFWIRAKYSVYVKFIDDDGRIS